MLEMLTGGFLVIVGGGIGFSFGRISRKHRFTNPKKVSAICEGCRHNYSWVDKETGMCLSPKDVATKYDRFGDPIAWVAEPCGCPTYNGPLPLPEYYAPEIGQ